MTMLRTTGSSPPLLSLSELSVPVLHQLPAPSLPVLEQQLGRAIAERIGQSRYDLWFRGHTQFVLQGETLLVGVPNLHFQEWLLEKFGDEVRSAAAEVLGYTAEVRFVIDPELFRAARAEQEAAKSRSSSPLVPSPRTFASEPEKVSSPTAVASSIAESQKTSMAEPQKSLRPARRWHSLQDFVVGPCNRVAHASAVSVVEEPGQGANPLVLHGPVGTGKTHLLEGIYAGLRKRFPDLRVQFVTAEEFVNRFVQTTRFGKQGAFRKTFRECGALLLDDLNFLAKKRATQEEFLHTFDALMADGRQMVLTMDCHPRLSEDLLPELVDRLLGGAVWGLLPPDAETRLAILRAKSAAVAPRVPEEVLQFLARQLRGNVRELEGALNSVRHFSKVTGRPIDVPLAREALADLLRHAVKVVGLADVDRAVCRVLRLPDGQLQSKIRSWAVSHPRMLAVYLCRKHTSASYTEVAKYFGAKTHSSAVAAEKKVRHWLDREEILTLGERKWRVQDLIERIERELGY